MLIIGTSTQYQLSFVNINATNQQTESNQMEDEATNRLIVLRNNDGSIIVRTPDQATKTKYSHQ
jgi:hypothetical protein